MYKTFIGVLVLIVVSAGCVSLASMSAGSIAQKMQEKYNTIKDYQGTVVVTTIANGKSKMTESDFIKMKKPDKILLVNKETGSVTVSNGTTLWVYFPKKNEVTIMKFPKKEKPKIGFGTIIKNMMERFNIKLLGTGKIAGRDTYILELMPKNKTTELLSTEKLWVGQKYWMPLKIEINMTVLNETTQVIVFYKNIKFNTNMSDSDFQYIIPKGAKVVNLGTYWIPKKMTLQEAQKKVNFTIFTPSYLPEGYKFEYARFLTFGKKIIGITYKKEDSKILIYFSEYKGTKPFLGIGAKVVNINGNKGYYFSINTLNVLSWTFNNMVFRLTSQLSKKEMEEIAESVK